MATIASLALAIRARTEELRRDLQPSIDSIRDWGKSAMDAGRNAREVTREMQQMERYALQHAKAADQLAISLQKEVQVLEAGTEGARQRVLIQQRLDERLKTGIGNEQALTLARRAAELELKNLNEREAEHAAKAAASADRQMTLVDRLRQGKTALAAMTGAVGAFASSMDGAAGVTLRLGSSLAGAFLAGGPVALGITAVAAGISAITSAGREAEEMIKRVSEAAARAREEGVKTIGRMQNDLARKQDQLDVARGGMSQFDADTRDLKRGWELRLKETEEAIAKETQSIADWTEERRKRLELMESNPMLRGGENEREINKRTASIDAARERVAQMQRELELAQKIVGVDLKAVEHAKETKALEDGKRQANEAGLKLAEARVQQLREQVKLEAQSADAAAEAAEARNRESQAIAQMMNAGYGAMAGKPYSADAERAAQRAGAAESARLDKLSDESFLKLGRRLNAFQAEHAARQRTNEELRRELTLLEAGNDSNRARLEIQNRLADRLKEMKGNEEAIALAKKIAAQELVNLAREEAEAARSKAEEERKATIEKQKQRDAMKKLDITKRFSRVGNSMFGFGAGMAGMGAGDFTADSERAWRAAGNIPGKGKGVGSAPAQKLPDLPDASPLVKSMEEQLAKIQPIVQRVHDALVSADGRTKKGVTDLAASTGKGLARLESQQQSFEAEMRAKLRAIERAGNRSGVGD